MAKNILIIYFVSSDPEFKITQNLGLLNLDQDPCFDRFSEDPTSSVCVLLVTKKLMDTNVIMFIFIYGHLFHYVYVNFLCSLFQNDLICYKA